MRWRSEPQIAAVVTSTMASWSFRIRGSGASETAIWFLPCHVTARMSVVSLGLGRALPEAVAADRRVRFHFHARLGDLLEAPEPVVDLPRRIVGSEPRERDADGPERRLVLRLESHLGSAAARCG